ncbi:alpha-ketoglutarate-dependent dioxygenase AlkB [Raineyella sp. LH-20]|uniref:alpha-ketoglutarate-dependent dioxygenase AlkB n=1 Tax=Raineyella sp. LH-20 TaxID=3081204 RepID=UPI0029533267|nr:alpha-ketoglutarate-dependent dioxygenase AlkB [Raineyella sp. LH-20]WOP20069.1 alpha-ketoglutarate-dependent dioxygenase AlkB [Raineyella sp. LH-20]
MGGTATIQAGTIRVASTRAASVQAEALFPVDVVDRPIRRLGPDATHLPDLLTLEQQRRLVAGARSWAGQQITARGATLRRHVTEVPDWVIDIARGALRRGLPSSTESEPDPDEWTPDSALVTHLAPGAALRVHRPKGTGPVVILSIGDSGEFRLGNTQTPTRPYRTVLLESGDAFVYGGVARSSFIGMPRTRPGTAPDWCGLTEGRIDIALTTISRAGDRAAD